MGCTRANLGNKRAKLGTECAKWGPNCAKLGTECAKWAWSVQKGAEKCKEVHKGGAPVQKRAKNGAQWGSVVTNGEA